MARAISEAGLADTGWTGEGQNTDLGSEEESPHLRDFLIPPDECRGDGSDGLRNRVFGVDRGRFVNVAQAPTRARTRMQSPSAVTRPSPWHAEPPERG